MENASVHSAILTEGNALALCGKEMADGSARILAATDKVAVFSSNQIKSQIMLYSLGIRTSVLEPVNRYVPNTPINSVTS